MNNLNLFNVIKQGGKRIGVLSPCYTLGRGKGEV